MRRNAELPWVVPPGVTWIFRPRPEPGPAERRRRRLRAKARSIARLGGSWYTLGPVEIARRANAVANRRRSCASHHLVYAEREPVFLAHLELSN